MKKKTTNIQKKQKTLQQLIPQILQLSTQKKIFQALQKYDQLYLQNQRFEMIRKMPLQLRPNQNILSRKQQTNFTGLYATVKQNAYQYSKQNLSNIFEAMRIKKEQPPEQNIKKQQSQFQVQFHQGDQAIPGVRSPQENKTLGDKLFGGNRMRFQSRQAMDPNSFAPFVSTNSNFTDINANAKYTKQKGYLNVYNSSSQNTAYLARGGKYQAFNTFGFPSSIMRGNIQHPKDTIFSNNSQLNVKDVLKYTLGVRDDKSEIGGREKLINPFNRPPSIRKY